MPSISVRDLDGLLDERTVPEGTTAAEIFPERSTVVARVGDVLRDLSYVVADGDVLEAVPVDSEDGRSVLRHSTAHVLAQAVQQLFPEAKLGIGPPIRDGFYYDFDVERPFTPDDLAALEKRMQEIVKSGQRFARRVVTEDDARAELAHEPYKLELIGLKGGSSDELDDVMEVGGAELTIYDNIDAKTGERAWCDLCRGPHVPDHPRDPGVQAHALRGGVLARQREEPDAAAHLRHRVGEPRRAQGAPRVPGRGREARPPPPGHRARPVQLPRRDRLRAWPCSTPRAA